ncbi:MAG: hypothetical protein AB3N16_00230 [Flavobacteriaceae bacterium]
MKGKKLLSYGLPLSLIVLLTGLVFRIAHWPNASLIMLIGYFLLAIFYGLRFYGKPEKRMVDYLKMTLVVFWTSYGILRILDFPYTTFFQVTTVLAFIAWFIMEGAAYFFKRGGDKKGEFTQIIWNIILVVGVLALIGGLLLKLLQSPYAIAVIVLGIVLITAFVLKDLFFDDISEETDSSGEELQL